MVVAGGVVVVSGGGGHCAMGCLFKYVIKH